MLSNVASIVVISIMVLDISGRSLVQKGDEPVIHADRKQEIRML